MERKLQAFGRADLLDATKRAMDIIENDPRSNHCFNCGWKHPEGKKVSGCPKCSRSFCS